MAKRIFYAVLFTLLVLIAIVPVYKTSINAFAFYQYQAGSRDCWGEYNVTMDHSTATEAQQRFKIFIKGSDGLPLEITTLSASDTIWITDANVGVSTDGLLIVYSGADGIVDEGEAFSWAANTAKNQAAGGDGSWVTAPQSIAGTFPKISSDINGTIIATFKGRTNISLP